MAPGQFMTGIEKLLSMMLNHCDSKPGDGLCDANGRGKHPVGEDIFIDPRIGSRLLLAVADGMQDRKSTRLNSSHSGESRMPSSA